MTINRQINIDLGAEPKGRRSHRWIGPQTYQKECDFSGIVDIHISICKGIQKRCGRPGDPPYVFIDMHGGPGHLRDDAGREFRGSGLIAADALAKSYPPYRYATLHHEEAAAPVAELIGAFDPRRYPHSIVRHISFEAGIKEWLGRVPAHPYRYGLVYSDPIEDPIPVEVFNQIAKHSPRMDLLAYVSANNQYKRTPKHDRRLAEDISAVNKKKVIIREPKGGEQYTFILWTDWTEMPAWTSHGFHELKSTGTGRDILNRLNFTRPELHQMNNTPLSEEW